MPSKKDIFWFKWGLSILQWIFDMLTKKQEQKEEKKSKIKEYEE